MTTKFNKKEYRQIKDCFNKSPFHNRLIFLGVHGSSVFKEIAKTSKSDFDIELILKYPKEGDYNEVKKILNDLPFKIECQLRYSDEIENNTLISKTAYKIFMYYSYANGVTLIGNNIYKKVIKNLSPDLIKQSYLISTQIAFKDIRKAYLGNKSPYEVNKQTLRFLICTCFYFGYIPNKLLGTIESFALFEEYKIIDICIDRLDKILTNNDKENLINFKKYVKDQKNKDSIFLTINDINKKLFSSYNTKNSL